MARQGVYKAPSSPNESTTVLIVEDHPIVLMSLRALLKEMSDLQVIAEARSCEAAYACIADAGPDLIILPLRLAGELSGGALCREIVESNPTARVLVYSSFDSPDKASAGFLSGARSLVDKAEDSSALLRIIRGGGSPGSSSTTIGERDDSGLSVQASIGIGRSGTDAPSGTLTSDPDITVVHANKGEFIEELTVTQPVTANPGNIRKVSCVLIQDRLHETVPSPPCWRQLEFDDSVDGHVHIDLNETILGGLSVTDYATCTSRSTETRSSAGPGG